MGAVVFGANAENPGGKVGMRRFSAFRGNEDGAVALIFAITALLLCATVGGAIDFAQAYRAQSAVQNSVDAAALAAARVRQVGGSEAEALAAAETIIARMKEKLPINGSVKFTNPDPTSVKGTAEFFYKTSFISVIGMDKLSVRSSSTASFGIGAASKTNVELVMMLDVTGSMKGQKIKDLKDAAVDLLEIVVSDDQSGAYSKVGLAPFANAVSLDNQMFNLTTGKTVGGKKQYSGCVVERTGSGAFTDIAPEATSYLVPLEDAAPGADCESGREVVPLTSNKGKLRGKIESLRADGTTAGHLGTAWAWYLLSSNWSAVLSGESIPAPYSDLGQVLPNGAPKLRKIAVLMTDGEYNTQYSGTKSNEQAQILCQNMKAAGIDVYAVGFDLGGNQSAIDTLSGCASDASKFYNTTTGEELRMAFRDIALRAVPLRIVK